MTFDPTLSLGNLLTILVMGVGGLFFLTSMKAQVEVLIERLRNYEEIFKTVHVRLDKIEFSITAISALLTKSAVQEERLDNQDKRMNEFARRLNEFESGFAKHSGTPSRARKKAA